MGNYCSSGQNKKDGDNLSQNSEDSPSYKLASKNKNKNSSSNTLKEAPLVDPEPTSDISNFNAPHVAGHGTKNGNITASNEPVISGTNNFRSSHDPIIGSLPNVDTVPRLSKSLNQQTLPSNLSSVYGKPSQSRRTENDRKIVLYTLSADENHRVEKNILNHLYGELQQYSLSHGFELLLIDLHENCDDFLDPNCWVAEPLEARGGHHLAAACLSEISRHSSTAYIVPIIFLGTTLGSPLLPLTIESQDFISSIDVTACGSNERHLLEKWYILDENSEPPCYCLKIKDVPVDAQVAEDLKTLYKVLIDIFSKELRDSYLTTVIEQEINNMVFISQEVSKRCIWIHTGLLPTKNVDGIESVEAEMVRRLSNIQKGLKNQLADKNLVRIPPTVQLSNEQLTSSLKALIAANIDSIIEDHTVKFKIPHCTFGIDRVLLSEIELVKQHSQFLSQNCVNFEIMDQIKQYILKPSTEPLIIFGPFGSGKSALSAKIEHFIHNWLPECCFVMRYTCLTQISTNITSLIGSITEQVYYYTKLKPYRGPHTIEDYAANLNECIIESKFPLVILIDSLDDALEIDNNLNWLPMNLSDKVKLIITTATSSSQIDDVEKCGENDIILWKLKDRISKQNYVHLKPFSAHKWDELLTCGGDFFSANAQLRLPEHWKNCNDKIPLQAKLFWWFAWLGETNLADISFASISENVFEVLEKRFGKEIIRYLVSILIASRDGLCETEIIELLKQSNLVDEISVQQLWINICWIMSHGPILLFNSNIRFMDKQLKNIAQTRYANEMENAHKVLHDFYQSQKCEYTETEMEKCSYNKRKFIELPYHTYVIDNNQLFVQAIYLTDLSWIQAKLKATKCVQYILSDISLIDATIRKQHNHLKILQHFLETFIQSINYDADQFYPLFKYYLRNYLKDDPNDSNASRWLADCDAITSSYLDILISVSDSPSQTQCNGYDLISNLGDGYFVASLNTEREEICVWNVPKSEQVRVLRGIPQPTALCPVDNYSAAVLCRREIKIINLNKGEVQVTLKGVMNQKMPYFAYCNDAQHLVCLSRNRMYVNLMNLESGDCITTFKAGEDRFLNSLLVSGDGRILVCGDETQKPFPLLVWHLSQRKLLYDLRIPHHDFITYLSAITHEGSYVCVVTKELNEPAPNFIVVYDLQSGTLFKKWKPSCNTVSLSISQTNACVIAGLEDARILIWDLVTGNCKFILVGHTAPVTMLKLDPTGTVLLSTDKEGRDQSVRLWELSTGQSIAVHTPSKRITTCEILRMGKYIVLGLENEPNLVTLELKNSKVSNNIANQLNANTTQESSFYGDVELNGKIFQL